MLDEFFNYLFMAFTALGNALTLAMQGICGFIGIELPDWAARIVLLISASISIFWFNRKIPKLLLISAIVIAASILLGFL